MTMDMMMIVSSNSAEIDAAASRFSSHKNDPKMLVGTVESGSTSCDHPSIFFDDKEEQIFLSDLFQFGGTDHESDPFLMLQQVHDVQPVYPNAVISSNSDEEYDSLIEDEHISCPNTQAMVLSHNDHLVGDSLSSMVSESVVKKVDGNKKKSGRRKISDSSSSATSIFASVELSAEESSLQQLVKDAMREFKQRQQEKATEFTTSSAVAAALNQPTSLKSFTSSSKGSALEQEAQEAMRQFWQRKEEKKEQIDVPSFAALSNASTITSPLLMENSAICAPLVTPNPVVSQSHSPVVTHQVQTVQQKECVDVKRPQMMHFVHHEPTTEFTTMSEQHHLDLIFSSAEEQSFHLVDEERSMLIDPERIIPSFATWTDLLPSYATSTTSPVDTPILSPTPDVAAAPSPTEPLTPTIAKVEVPATEPAPFATSTSTVFPALPLKTLSAYNFFFRDEHERIVNGGTFDSSMAKQQKLLQDHWSQSRAGAKPRRNKFDKSKTGSSKIPFTTLSKLIATRWRELSISEKAFYQNLANKDFERYQRDLHELRANGHHISINSNKP